MNTRISKKIAIIVVSLCAMCMLLCSCGGAKVDCVTIMAEPVYTGCNGSATIEAKVDSKEVEKIVETVASNEEEAAELKTFFENFTYEPDKKENLANGDEITLTAKYDEKVAEKYKLNIKSPTQKIKVEGLPLCADNTLYKCVKDGDYVYCLESDISKVNLKTQEREVLVPKARVQGIYVKDNYLYYLVHVQGLSLHLKIHRYNLGTCEDEVLTDDAYAPAFAVKGDYIYYNHEKTRMKLDGSEKEWLGEKPDESINVYTLDISIDVPIQDCNVPGYKITEEAIGMIDCVWYLDTPDGRIELTKAQAMT